MNHEERVEHILQQWKERRAAGEDPSAEEMCRDFPECLEDLKSRIEAIKRSFAGAPTNAMSPTRLDVPDRPPIPSLEELQALFPQFEILELLGAGGMGVVYKIRQPVLNRVAALKLVRPSADLSAVFSERFLREAQTMAHLNDSRIVQVYDFGQVGDLHYLVMEYVDGQNLRQLLRSGSVGPRQALQLVEEICAGLHYAHEEGVIHRDIKPENVLIDHKGRVKLADFGLAKLLGTRTEHALTGTQQVMGTADYMAPEQTLQSRSVDHRADLYSVGIILYELLTGTRPRGDFVPASRRVPVNAKVDGIIRRALAQQPADRFQSARELQEAVSELTGRSGDKRLSSGHRKSGWRSVRPWLISGGAVTVGLAVIAFLWWYVVAASGPSSTSFRWGADSSGGAPYVWEYERKQYTGFEVELADYLASRMGLKSEFIHKAWDMLPQDLQRRDIDVVLNGYEWSADREEVMASTIPYYIYRLQLVVGPESPITDWSTLHQPKPGGGPWQVGVLADSAAHRFVEREYSREEVKIVALSEEGSTGVLNMLRGQTPQLDASVQDSPLIRYYIQQKHGYEDLRVVGDPIQPGYYVMYVRKEDARLRQQLNEGLRQALADGTLKQIYEKYGLWNEEQEKLLEVSRSWPPQIVASNMSWVDYAWMLLGASATTILLACLSMPLAIVIGLSVAIGRVYGPRLLGGILGVYVEILRGTPLLMQLFVIFYLLPHMGLSLPAFWAGVMGLAINYSAYEAEIYRAGLLAIPREQMEAALSLGMSKSVALRRVIVPQAVRLVVPPVTNDFIALFKDTSICSVIAVMELTGRFRGLMVNHPQHLAQLGLLTAALYLLMSYPLAIIARRLEKKTERVVA